MFCFNLYLSYKRWRRNNAVYVPSTSSWVGSSLPFFDNLWRILDRNLLLSYQEYQESTLFWAFEKDAWSSFAPSNNLWITPIFRKSNSNSFFQVVILKLPYPSPAVRPTSAVSSSSKIPLHISNSYLSTAVCILACTTAPVFPRLSGWHGRFPKLYFNDTMIHWFK